MAFQGLIIFYFDVDGPNNGISSPPSVFSPGFVGTTVRFGSDLSNNTNIIEIIDQGASIIAQNVATARSSAGIGDLVLYRDNGDLNFIIKRCLLRSLPPGFVYELDVERVDGRPFTFVGGPGS